MLPSDLQTALPTTIEPGRVRAAVRAPGSPGSLGGETWVLDLDGKLAVLVRSSIFDTLALLELVDIGQAVELRPGPELEVRPAHGAAFVVRPLASELDAITSLLAQVDGNASFEPPTVELADPVVTRPRAVSRPESTTLTDLDQIDPDLEAAVGEAIGAGELGRAIAAATELARQSTPREREGWNDLVELLALARAGEWVAAYLWTRGVRQVPVMVREPLFGRIAAELERRNELALTWAALVEAEGDSMVDGRARIERQLKLDPPTIVREVAERAKAFFSSPAESGDPLAQRGLARALLDLDELRDALTWVRRATHASPTDFEARMLETEILALLAIETQDTRELRAVLIAVGDAFPDRPEPLVDLAELVEYDDPAWAITLLRSAQAREFDQFALVTLVDLLISSGETRDAIREIEQALADLDAVSLVEDELRQRLATARKQTSSPTGSTQAQAISVVVIAVAIAVLILAGVLVLFM